MKTRFSTFLAGVVALAFAIGGVVRAPAYVFILGDDNLPVKWYTPTIPIQVKADNATHLSDGNTRATSIVAAMTDPARGWNQYLGTIQFVPTIAATGSGTDHDHVNQVFFDATPYSYGWDGNTLAVTTIWYSGGQRTEGDVIVNTAFTWDSYRGAKGGKTAYDLQRVALHELGHVLGLDHPDENYQSVTAIMNSTVSDIDSIQGDDINGAQFLYGAPGVHPANDTFANATVIQVNSGNFTQSGGNIGATKEAGEPNHANDAGGHSVWWKWIPQTSGTYSLDTSGSNFDTSLGVYTGSTVTGLTSIASNDDIASGLFFSSVTLTATGGTTYYIAVDGSGGASGSALNLNIVADTIPVINSQPAAQMVTAGQSASFYASFSGTPYPTVKWQRWPAGGSGWADLANGNGFFGTDGNYLTISLVTSAMNGDQFRCVATNAAGSTATASAALTVIPAIPPVIAVPASATVDYGASLSLAATVSGSTPMTFQWKKDGADLPGMTSGYLYYSSATSDTAGSYTLTATNYAGTVTSAAVIVTVNPPVAPTVAGLPATLTLDYGATISLVPTITGSQPLSYQWKKDGALIANATYSSFSKYGATQADSGSYTVTVSNVAGTVVSTTVMVSVNPPVAPTISGLPANLSVSIGGSLNFSPTVSGSQPITYQWTKDGNAIGGGSSSYSKYSLTAGDSGQYTLTATNLVGSVSATVTVSVRPPLNLTQLVRDPYRPVVYGLQNNGDSTGNLLVLDPATLNVTTTVTVGINPNDLAISDDGGEMLVICSGSKALSVINLNTLQVTGTIALPNYGVFDSYLSSGHMPTGHVQYGAGNIIYYTDGSWAPVLNVFDRSTSTVKQAILSDGRPSANSAAFGFGGFALSPDRQTLYAWAQYGWNAGSAGSSVVRFTVNGDGTVTLAETGNYGYPTFLRDPMTTPVLVTADGSAVFIKQYEFSGTSVATPTDGFSGPVFAITPRGTVAATATALYRTDTNETLVTLPSPGGGPMAITGDGSYLVYYSTATQQLQNLSLTGLIDPSLLGLAQTPANGATLLPPTQVSWQARTGATAYRVYLGTSQSDVASATTASATYLGQTTGTSFNLPFALVAGTTYYWRVDVVFGTIVASGSVTQFHVANIAADIVSAKLTTVSGDKSQHFEVNLSSVTPGVSWTATTDNPALTFASSSGTTPATLSVKVDTTTFTPGTTTHANVTITSGADSIVIPVTVYVDPLALTMMRSDPGTTTVYAISEANASANDGSSRAYLLEIDTLFQRINRIVRVGSGVTDFAVHDGDQRIYVANWKSGSLLALDRASLELERVYLFTANPQVGYDSGDVYHVMAGRTGRVAIASEDQWIKLSLFDTASGGTVASTQYHYYYGGGVFEPTGRYLYFADTGSSDCKMHKIDTNGDNLTEVAANTTSGAEYNSNRFPVMSADGHRLFWAGVVFDENLNVETTLDSVIYSASSNGRLAFGENKVYDVALGRAIGAMPVSTKVSAFNSATEKLVVQNGGSLQFVPYPSANTPEATAVPANGVIVGAVSQLQWGAIAGATAYRVYLGTSADAVANAGTSSAEYLGEVSTNSFLLPQGLPAGSGYFWRVDVVVGTEVAPGILRNFTVATVIPDKSSLQLATVQGDPNLSFALGLSSATNGAAWSVTSSAPCITFDRISGVAPDTVHVRIDTTSLAAGSYDVSVSVIDATGTTTIPVALTVEPLALTVLKSEPGTPTVFGLSEASPVNAGDPTHAYLLAIDAVSQAIVQVTPAGSGATDLAVHLGDNRVYVTNWRIGAVLGYNLQTLAFERKYNFSPFGEVGYGSQDAYRISAGQPGRLMVEPEDQWINIELYDTTAGAPLATSFQREGGGQFEPQGRYYYHGDDNDSGSVLHKFDTNGNVITSVATGTSQLAGYFGDRTVVISEDGKRVFWNGTVFDQNLASVWGITSLIYSTSADGRLAFGANSIFDTTTKTTIGSMPVSTTVSAFNSLTGLLVYQKGTSVNFYSVPLPPAAPTIAIQPASRAVTAGSAVTLAVVAYGSPLPTYQWSKDGVVLPWAIGNSISIAHTGRWDAGAYSVVVSNAGGTVTSATATLTVLAQPGDFNGDGRPDLTWTNAATGERRIWMLNGTAYGSEVSLGNIPAEWEISATADFNGDGLADILWTDAVTGERVIWLMNGSSCTGSVFLGVVPLEWHVGGAADFTGDGKVDIVWNDTLTGACLLWQMNGTAYGSTISLGTAPATCDISGVGDFDHDGKPDIVWTDISNGARYIWIMNGTAYGWTAPLGLVPPTLQITNVGDFNGDGWPDLLMTNLVTGDRTLWLMSGATHAGSVSLGAIPLDWKSGSGSRPVHAAKLNFGGASASDLLWENTATGDRYIWWMNEAQFVWAKPLGNLSPQWHLAASADFNGDGQADLVWENTATGERYVWLMNGAAFSASVNLGPVGSQWHIAAAGDFNGDGQTDLVWENPSTGEHYLWLMNGTTFVSSVYLATLPTEWHVADCGDFNGDGEPDLVWENTTTGERYLWLMNGPAYASAVYLGAISTDWRIAVAADFNLDGQTDLVWQNTATGERYLWLMNGSAFVSGQSLGSMPIAWRIVP